MPEVILLHGASLTQKLQNVTQLRLKARAPFILKARNISMISEPKVQRHLYRQNIQEVMLYLPRLVFWM